MKTSIKYTFTLVLFFCFSFSYGQNFVDKKIAIKFPPDLTDNPKSAYDVAFKAIDVMFNEKDERTVKECDYVINVKIPSGNVFNVKKIKDCYNKGYIETVSNIKNIKEIL